MSNHILFSNKKNPNRRFFLSKIKTVRLCLFSVFLLYSHTSFAIEFNTDVLDSIDKKNIDFSLFSHPGYIYPGVYVMQVYINGESLGGDYSIPFYMRNSESKLKGFKISEACLSPSLLYQMGLTDIAKKKIGTWHHGECMDLSELKGVDIKGDISKSSLRVNIPKVWMTYSDVSWVPPYRWDNGIPGVMFDYNANGGMYKIQGRGGEQLNTAINGTIGGNMDAWRLRADYQGKYSSYTGSSYAKQQDFDFTRIYLYRPLPSKKSELILGENYISSSIFDSWRYIGVSLFTDERMLPPKLRGYAPEIVGVAKTNARVIVTQQDRILYSSIVPAGPFCIQDLDSSIRGRLNVKVIEQNGTVQHFSVSASSVPYLTRPGQMRYHLAFGRPSNWRHKVEGGGFVNDEASWGINNNWSLYGGSTLSSDYQALAAGFGRDLHELGSASLDVTQSLAKLPQYNKQGKSWRLSYSKHFDDTNTDLTFAGYRFSTRNYLNMQQYLDLRHSNISSGYQKERYQINIYDRFNIFTLPLSLALNYEWQTYWEQGSTREYGVNLGTWFDLPSVRLHNLVLTATATRSQYKDRYDNTVNLMMSVPFGNGTLNYNGSYGHKNIGQQVGFYDLVNQRDSYNLSAGFEQGEMHTSHSLLSGMYTHNGSLAIISANAALVSGSYKSLGLSANGGLTLTGKGAALHAGGYNGSTRLMIDTDGISGVPVDEGGVISNQWGIGVITNVSSYYKKTARINMNNMPENMEAQKSVVEATLTDGAIGYRRFGILKGEQSFVILRMADNSYPPFGAIILDKKGREHGIVGDNGLVWLAGVTPGSVFDVTWGGGKHCQIKPQSLLKDQNTSLLCSVSVNDK
ncbi:fimbria/pilus outer membrane usher protein [Salmonella enterica]|uniref:Fimbria/pilus outer membrane usher protein n=2 Tax=Salmonella diarizonae TaxID=59204 RepID=A0A6Y2KRR7_SALDZ|nr:PapC/FimD family outer membrane usher protein [Salmonella enterica subsp. enterica]EDG5146791.1 fimbria/pilus outer membrane usher protein [Salmonella enterica subsp. enterica serovar Bovismorbificans]EJL4441243.1 fimbria/pilus outer membrane usher protein [Salmonella enterica]HAB4467464.1 fimbria/pilus outer membrane usher protein [Salmonella enterica subsp. diarizonae]EDT7283538.1 fimbria/pilus outer membrane usher protein [Salmonella enterica subsp. enterica]